MYLSKAAVIVAAVVLALVLSVAQASHLRFGKIEWWWQYNGDCTNLTPGTPPCATGTCSNGVLCVQSDSVWRGSSWGGMKSVSFVQSPATLAWGDGSTSPMSSQTVRWGEDGSNGGWAYLSTNRYSGIVNGFRDESSSEWDGSTLLSFL